MASMNFKRAAAVATMATSMMLFGGAAFASPGSPVAGDGQTGLAPAPISEVLQTVRNTEAEADRQVRQLQQLR